MNKFIKKQDMLCDLVTKSNGFFKNLMRSGCITEKELKYFSYKYKKITNLGKLYLLPKIHERLENVSGRPVISNCDTPAEKVSEFLDYHFKLVMQSGRSYIKDSGDFLKKIKNLGSLPKNAILVTADVEEALENKNYKQISTDKLVKMAQFVLKNNFFEFNNDVFQQLSATAIGTKFAPPFA